MRLNGLVCGVCAANRFVVFVTIGLCLLILSSWPGFHGPSCVWSLLNGNWPNC